MMGERIQNCNADEGLITLCILSSLSLLDRNLMSCNSNSSLVANGSCLPPLLIFAVGFPWSKLVLASFSLFKSTSDVFLIVAIVSLFLISSASPEVDCRCG
ncbi:hypothetical protein O6U65_2045 [Saccharomyces cerevisiae synthetic construct]|uniref:Putative uncharacterized protein YLR444C n=1 Tax=Saccharomyces cerevisiae (strain ATCC 204508 / S288c) TaxID=559292 RepID=YL444_YEAST|nr:RecName: Full=Putative uncharacterized protein YLR444C [Saccharomyces cerevisiae S288C]AAB67536.1 Ylr444cp [Saccharomyces cerevisiae]AAT93288.1 YLR444C [Saccharomyces cerevisiae]WNV73160.1 hypothetical protein O6U65_2045 [Saccharomyces cerevisiae synthetic construct]